MSYADVAATNMPPEWKQPKPDPALLNTHRPSASQVADDTKKVNVVAPSFKEEPITITSEVRDVAIEPDYSDEEDEGRGNVNGSEKRKRRKDRHPQLRNAEREAAGLWAVAKEKILQPGVAGGLLGVVNVGIIGYTSYALYSNPSLRRDTRFLSISSISLLALLGVEGYATERYFETPRGRAERERARTEGAALYRHANELIFRPGALGGLVGLLNVGILGGVGYAAWTNWERPKWDRRVVSAVSIGLLGLVSAEGALAEKVRREHERDRKGKGKGKFA